jgi:hypothetical protein
LGLGEPFQTIAKENLQSDPRAFSKKYLSGTGANVFLLAAQCGPTGRPTCEACARVETDLEILQKDIAGLFEKVESLRELPTIAAGVLITLLQYEVSPLMQRAAEIGGPAFREFRALERIQGWLMKALLSTISA